jgi:uncharacterized protein YecT (DUF1311 family)
MIGVAAIEGCRMRLLALVFLGLLSAAPAHARDPREYKANEASIVKCAEAAEQVLTQTGIDIRRECIGVQTQNCMSTTDDNTYASNKRMYCAGAEAVAWHALMEKAYNQLLERYAKWDQEQSAATSGMKHEPVVPALKAAHEAWSKLQDCEFAHIQPGQGTDRYDAPARCARYKNAERALLYREWLSGSVFGR